MTTKEFASRTFYVQTLTTQSITKLTNLLRSDGNLEPDLLHLRVTLDDEKLFRDNLVYDSDSFKDTGVQEVAMHKIPSGNVVISKKIIPGLEYTGSRVMYVGDEELKNRKFLNYNTSFTTLEFDVLRAITENALDAMGGNTAQDLITDNFSWFTLKDISKLLPNLKKSQISGVIGSLTKKGLISEDTGNADPKAASLFLSTVGINTAISFNF